MTFDDFVKRVQYQAHLGSIDDAVRAIRATTTTLGEQIDADDAEMMAAKLPPELGWWLLARGRKKARRFSSDEFFTRVATRERVDIPAAVFHCRVVFEVLCDVMPRCEIAEVLDRFSLQFRRIIFSRIEGRLKVRNEAIQMGKKLSTVRRREAAPLESRARNGSGRLSKETTPLSEIPRSQRRYGSRTE